MKVVVQRRKASETIIVTNLQAITAPCSPMVRLVLENHIHSSDMAPTSKICIR